jgi:O-antigen ligase
MTLARTTSATYRPLVYSGLLAVCALAAVVLGSRRTGDGWLTFAAAASATAVATSSVFATHPSRSVLTLALPAVLLVASQATALSLEELSAVLRRVSCGYALASVAAIALIPTLALERPYDGVLSLGVRLHGVAPHANSLGALMAAGIAGELYGRRDSGNHRHPYVLGLLSIVLVLTQSKTSVAALAATVLLVGVLANPRITRTDKTMVSTAISAVATYFLVGGASNEAAIAQTVGGLGTLTGRTRVWAITLTEWQDNPLFGYGQTVWGLEMKMLYLPVLRFAPGQAHNQVVQALGESGLVGLLTLAVLLIGLLRLARFQLARHNTLALALLVLLVSRGLTETVLPRSALDAGVVLLVLTILAARATTGACEASEAAT